MSSENVKVTVPICVYNHEKYLRDCIQGIAIQQCDFEIEVLIADDCSTDGTREVMKELVDTYPQLTIRLFFREKNLGPSGNTIQLLAECRGKYLALCDGDDYWTDPLKLQRQVAFLEQNPEYSLVYHNVTTNSERVLALQNDSNFSFGLRDSLRKKHGATLSMVFRNFMLDRGIPPFFKDVLSGDWSIEVILMTAGKGYYFGNPMGFYRAHPGGMTKSEDFKKLANRAKWNFIRKMLFWTPRHSFTFVKFLIGYRRWVLS